MLCVNSLYCLCIHLALVNVLLFQMENYHKFMTVLLCDSLTSKTLTESTSCFTACGLVYGLVFLLSDSSFILFSIKVEKNFFLSGGLFLMGFIFSDLR